MNENLAVGRGFFVVFSSMTGKHTHTHFVFRAAGAPSRPRAMLPGGG
jgi:hypothetical protein